MSPISPRERPCRRMSDRITEPDRVVAIVAMLICGGLLALNHDGEIKYILATVVGYYFGRAASR